MNRDGDPRALPGGTVTFLFTDIEGSTRLVARLGEHYATVLADHQRLLREAFAASAGREIDTQGDAFFVVFPRAKDAVAAALAGQRALTTHHWPEDASVRVRMWSTFTSSWFLTCLERFRPKLRSRRTPLRAHDAWIGGTRPLARSDHFESPSLMTRCSSGRGSGVCLRRRVSR